MKVRISFLMSGYLLEQYRLVIISKYVSMQSAVWNKEWKSFSDDWSFNRLPKPPEMRMYQSKAMLSRAVNKKELNERLLF